MRLAAAISADDHHPGSEIETVYLSAEQADFIERLSARINPDMPLAFGNAHVVRVLLEQIEEAGIDLTSSASENEIASAAATAQRRRRSRG